MAPATETPTCIFVYGTLRTSFARLPGFHTMGPPQLLQTQNQFLGVANLTGYRLYLVGDDNGVVPVVSSDPSASTVVGDVFTVHESQLPELDEYEMMSQRYTKPYMYRRVSVHVDLLCDGRSERKLVWLYIYNWPLPSNAVLVEDGDYIEYHLRLLTNGPVPVEGQT